MAGFIDLHHHFFPQDLDKANASAQVGWRTPEENLPWTPELSIKAMGSAGIQAAVLSFPASASGQVSAENRVLARSRNDYVAAVCRKYPDRFGFFATLPFLDDVRGVLDEITYAFDVIGADGISVSSSYGEGATAAYVGHDKYDSIWAELDRRKAVVFLHGNALPSSVPWPHPTLGLPISEVCFENSTHTGDAQVSISKVPNETFKAAAHLVVTGRKRRYPNIKIILAHLGGSTPFLASRVAVLSHYMGCELTPEQILDDFKSFYYDTALSAWGPNLIAMDNFVSHTQILFGTDFPAVSTEMSNWYTHQLEHHYGADCSGNEKLQAIGWRNALDMFPQLRERIFAANNGTEGARRLQCMLRL